MMKPEFEYIDECEGLNVDPMSCTLTLSPSLPCNPLSPGSPWARGAIIKL